MPADIRTALTACQLSLTFQNARLLLGSRRQLSVHLLGS